MELTATQKRSLELLVGKVAAADLKVTRLRTLLLEKGVFDESELEMAPHEAETFIVEEFSEILRGLGLTQEEES